MAQPNNGDGKKNPSEILIEKEQSGEEDLPLICPIYPVFPLSSVLQEPLLGPF